MSTELIETMKKLSSGTGISGTCSWNIFRCYLKVLISLNLTDQILLHTKNYPNLLKTSKIADQSNVNTHDNFHNLRSDFGAGSRVQCLLDSVQNMDDHQECRPKSSTWQQLETAGRHQFSSSADVEKVRQNIGRFSSFLLQLMLSSFITAKLFINSVAPVSSLVEIHTNQSLSSPLDWTTTNMTSHLLGSILFEDSFRKFKSRRWVNMIALCLMLPNTVARFITLFDLLKRVHSRRLQQQINIVQLNLSYLSALNTTTRHWLKLFVESWRHKHLIVGCTCRSMRLMLRIAHLEGCPQTCLGIKRKLYLYNTIEFNRCYHVYFPRLKENQNRRKDRDLFVAKPLHRMDLNEMAWLLLMLMVLYVMVPISVILPIIFAFQIETNSILATTNQLNHLSALSLIVRSSYIILWQCLIMLDVLDLFNFFSGCLICFSRAKHLRLNLRKVSEYCQQLTGSQSDGRGTTDTQDVDEGSACPERLKASVNLRGKQIHILNMNIELLNELSVLVLQEFYDIKKYFTSFLNLEILLRVLAIMFAVMAIFEELNWLELGFVVVNCNTAAMPIAIVLIMAALIEGELRSICKYLDLILTAQQRLVSVDNQRRTMLMADHLSTESNRCFVILGNFSLSLGSVISVVAWIATGVVMMRR